VKIDQTSDEKLSGLKSDDQDRDDNKESLEKLLEDFICFSWQIAQGMVRKAKDNYEMV